MPALLYQVRGLLLDGPRNFFLVGIVEGTHNVLPQDGCVVVSGLWGVEDFLGGLFGQHEGIYGGAAGSGSILEVVEAVGPLELRGDHFFS